MIRITNGIDECGYSTYNPAMMRLGSQAASEERPCIRINGMMIFDVDLEGLEKMNYNEKAKLLENVFSKFCRYNYPTFWRNPLRHIFGIKKCYDWQKFRYY